MPFVFCFYSRLKHPGRPEDVIYTKNSIEAALLKVIARLKWAQKLHHVSRMEINTFLNQFALSGLP